ncbi:DUF317 domain-containing protein [Streptomyces sp. RGM 3693]|uniref:DUF317 domain-containing protein n=1 Tax=Streptomyces sp. RGM 3693 TaxID=3413284 RepID=UPI003D2946B7
MVRLLEDGVVNRRLEGGARSADRGRWRRMGGPVRSAPCLWCASFRVSVPHGLVAAFAASLVLPGPVRRHILRESAEGRLPLTVGAGWFPLTVDACHGRRQTGTSACQTGGITEHRPERGSPRLRPGKEPLDRRIPSPGCTCSSTSHPLRDARDLAYPNSPARKST